MVYVVLEYFNSLLVRGRSLFIEHTIFNSIETLCIYNARQDALVRTALYI